MRVEKTEETGFCFGVKRSMRIVEEAVAEYGRIETLGPLVHNRRVVDGLKAKGVGVVTSPEEVSGQVVVICSHGVPPSVAHELTARGLKVIDSTCPNVRRAQQAARDFSKAGFGVIVFGDPDHPEVKGILGWAEGKGLAVSDGRDIAGLNGLPKRVGLISQTTRNPGRLAEFVNRFVTDSMPRLEELRVVNTLCNVTQIRQAEAIELARKVDLMIVVGDRSSANTRELARVCSSAGTPTHHVEGAVEIQEEWLGDRLLVGVTTGTSIPDEVTQEVMDRLERVPSK